MEIVIKLRTDSFEKLRAATSSAVRVSAALDSATRIDYAVDGVTFSGYEVRCSYEEARLLHVIAKEYCPEAIFDLEKVLKAAIPRNT